MLRILGDEAKDVDPTMEDLKRMDYMTLIIKEVCAHSDIKSINLLMYRPQRIFADTGQWISCFQETPQKTLI